MLIPCNPLAKSKFSPLMGKRFKSLQADCRNEMHLKLHCIMLSRGQCNLFPQFTEDKSTSANRKVVIKSLLFQRQFHHSVVFFFQVYILYFLGCTTSLSSWLMSQQADLPEALLTAETRDTVARPNYVSCILLRKKQVLTLPSLSFRPGTDLHFLSGPGKE